MGILKKICPPARFYLGFSVVILIIMLLQNIFNNNNKELCFGSYKCDIPSVGIFLGVESLYILFWTWVLNILCKSGLKSVSWFLVLLPFLLFFVVLSLLIYKDIEKKRINN